MKAVRLHAYGGSDNLRYEETDDPQLTSPHDAVVRLKAASVNHLDILIRRGLSSTPAPFPHILGSDGSGTISAVGAEVTNVKSGDAVCLYPASSCGRCEFCNARREHLCGQRRLLGERENGTYAEYVRVPASNCYPIPQGLSFEEAAAFPLVYATTWRMLVSDAELKPGESVLIVGAGGGIATAALQVAASMGTHIFVTSTSEDKLAMAKRLGAEYGINSRTADFAREVRNLTNKRGVDVVVDCIGGDGWVKSFAALTKGGRLVTCGAIAGADSRADLRRVFWNHLKIFGSMVGTREEFREVLNFMSVTRTKPILDRVFSLKDAAKAQQRMEAGQQFGKIVLSMDG
ncbi:MAG TPA: zinc-binding dehydrogenase [Candidatus Binatia bacterium]